MQTRKIAVVGGGAWGSALAVHLARCGHPVGLWMRERELIERIRTRRDNPTYLPGVTIPEGVEPSCVMREAIDEAEIVVTAVPSQFARAVYRQMSEDLPRETPVVVASKGIEEVSLALPLTVAGEELGTARPLAVLSGPSFAPEVARGRPTAVVVACENTAAAVRLQEALGSRELRLYTNRDVVGVQVAGALKNVIAVAAGIADGLGMGHNSLAALITRGLAELTRLVVAMGGKRETTSGLAGMGDLVLTCTGAQSRNRAVGQRIGQGERLQDILAGSRSVAEGVRTTRSARMLALREGVDMPIVEGVYDILYEDGSPQQGLDRLLSRPFGSEEWRPVDRDR